MSLEKLSRIFEEKDEFIILSHHNSDLDALGSSIFLKDCLEDMGKNVRMGVSKSVSKLSKRILKKFGEDVIVNPKVKDSEEVIVLDTPSFEQLEPIDLGKNNIYLIDHHSSQSISKTSKISYIDEGATSTCELVYEISNELNCPINRKMSLLLLLGIIYDTGHLKYAKVETFELVSRLLENTEKSYGEVVSMLHMKTDISERIAKLKSANRMDIYRINDYLVVFSEVGSFESSSAMSLVKFSADIAIVGNRKNNEVRISGRCNKSISKRIDLVDDVFKYISDIIDGSAGGHSSAASANGKNTDGLEKAFDEILKRLENKLEGNAKKLN